jgi:hypothetical protein
MINQIKMENDAYFNAESQYFYNIFGWLTLIKEKSRGPICKVLHFNKRNMYYLLDICNNKNFCNLLNNIITKSMHVSFFMLKIEN